MTKINPANPQTLDFGAWLSNLDDSHLKEILTNRADVTYPLPPGIGSLAARLKLRASTRRAIHQLTASDIAVLEATAVLGGEIKPVTYPDLVEELDTVIPDGVIQTSVAALLKHALLFGTAKRFQIAPEVMAALPQQWSLLENHQYDAHELQSLLARITEQQRKILHTLADSGGTGLSKDAAVDADPKRPIPQLIALKLLQRVDTKTVRLPMAVRSILLGKPLPKIPLSPPTVADRQAEGVEKLAAAAALEAVRLVRSFIEYTGHTPLPLLKDGAIGVRAHTAIKTALQCDERTSLRVLAVALAARLIDRGTPEGTDDTVLAPTTLAEEFLQAPLATQWALVIHGWWQHADFAPWLVAKTVRALSQDSVIPQLPASRRMILSHCTRPVALEELSQLVHYYAPLAANTHDTQLIGELIDEACWLGVLVANNSVLYPTAVFAPLLADGSVADVAAITQEHSPPVVAKLIPQGDMTLLAPGPLEHSVQLEINLLADLESPGLASVYRLSGTSIRRAFDAGRTVEDITAFLTKHVLGQLPQTVMFLIHDIARKHGQLRGGPALSYIRCDDEALLLQLSRSTAAKKVALRLLAPTVAISQAPLAQVFTALKAAGFHPVAEDDHGLSIDIRPKPIRVATPASPTMPAKVPDPEHIAAALAALRNASSEAATTANATPKTKLSPSTTIQAAIRLKQAVRLSFVDASGQATTIEVVPIAVTGGQVSAIEEKTGQLHRISLHRLTEAVIVNP